MKKLSKLKLNDFHEMTDMEMKNVVGGSGTSKCASTFTTASSTRIECWSTAAEAEEAAGEYGWWCCNCQDALDNC